MKHVIMLLVLVLTSCAFFQNAPEAPPPVEPPQETLPENIQGTVLRDASCNYDDAALTITIVNAETKTWQLDNVLPLVPPKDTIGITLSLNEFPMNEPVFLGGKRMFGTSVSEHCGQETLPPGENVTCTFRPIPVQSKRGVSATHTLVLSTEETEHVLSFPCYST